MIRFGRAPAPTGQERHAGRIRLSRVDRVVAQYDNRAAARWYADAHDGAGITARYFRSRIDLVIRILAAHQGGDLLDVGCGPGMMVGELLRSRPGSFRITAFDRSPAMLDECVRSAPSGATVRAVQGAVEAMPFADASFDVVLAMGVLEYTDIASALAQIVRVTRPDGVVLATMLNPVSPYRLVEWYIAAPARRFLHALRGSRVVAGPHDEGIVAFRARELRRLMLESGLRPVATVYYDVTVLVPGLRRLLPRRALTRTRRCGATATRGWRTWFGTAYLVVARPR
jgi:ubiquinone/menaquinone biosynthesis C-methylase UbiE